MIRIEKPRPCGACGRPVVRRTACIAFPTYHAACIERALALARAHDD